AARGVLVCRARYHRRREFAALLCELSVFRRPLLHVVEHRRGRPAIDLEPVRLLISAERRAREHAGLAVDLVLVEAELGERALHGLDLRGAQLRVLAPWRLEPTRIVDALAQMYDELHVEIGKIVFLDDVIVLEREERRTIGALRQEQRRRLVELRRGGLAAIGERKSLFEPIAERTRDLGDAYGAVHAPRRAHLIGPARAALPAPADELPGGGGERNGHRSPDILRAAAVEIDGVFVELGGKELGEAHGAAPGAAHIRELDVALLQHLERVEELLPKEILPPSVITLCGKHGDGIFRQPVAAECRL